MAALVACTRCRSPSLSSLSRHSIRVVHGDAPLLLHAKHARRVRHKARSCAFRSRARGVSREGNPQLRGRDVGRRRTRVTGDPSARRVGAIRGIRSRPMRIGTRHGSFGIRSRTSRRTRRMQQAGDALRARRLSTDEATLDDGRWCGWNLAGSWCLFHATGFRRERIQLLEAREPIGHAHGSKQRQHRTRRDQHVAGRRAGQDHTRIWRRQEMESVGPTHCLC
mmetsp:Transcript_1878/g.11278  ORF Transcript_1878/g.11278 Transcript_1878/m.11278 type:complete len:223 (+) Transcript_1878:3063-3731(+)